MSNLMINEENLASFQYGGLLRNSAFCPHIDKIREELDLLEEQEKASGEIIVTPSSLRSRYILRSKALQRAIHETGLYNFANTILDGRANIGSAQLNNVFPSKPNGEGLKWHVDYPYFAAGKQAWVPISDRPSPLAIQVIIAVDEFTVDNGATVFQRSGPIEVALLAPGEALVMRGDIPHAVPKNVTQRNRRAILMVFHPYWVRPISTRSGNLFQLLGVTPIDVIPELHPMFDVSTPLFNDLKKNF